MDQPLNKRSDTLHVLYGLAIIIVTTTLATDQNRSPTVTEVYQNYSTY